jgi:DNA-binding response OmpR family regulator
MKALVYGQKNIDKTLSVMLKNEGIEMQTLVDDFDTNTNLCLEEKYDLAIVDSRSDNANKACRFIRENWDIPLILVVNSLEVNWKRLKPIEADGYISDVNKGRELSARSRALLRRLLLKNKFQERKSGRPEQTSRSKDRTSPA